MRAPPSRFARHVLVQEFTAGGDKLTAEQGRGAPDDGGVFTVREIPPGGEAGPGQEAQTRGFGKCEGRKSLAEQQPYVVDRRSGCGANRRQGG